MTTQLSFFDSIAVGLDGAIALRGYQRDSIRQLDESFCRGQKSPLLCLPTGNGKTVIAAELIRRHVDAGGTALFLAPRRELIWQTTAKLTAIDVKHGVLLAGADHLRNLYATVQVASIDTLRSRLRDRKLQLLDPDLVIVDEAHLSVTKNQQKLLDRWPAARRIGLTATPTRKDGRALGTLYDTLIEPVTVAQLIAQGYLVPVRYFSIAEPDLQHVRITASDYNTKDLDAAVNRPELVGDVVQTWLQRAAGRRTIVFASSIVHSVALCEEFLQAGVSAEHVDAATPQADREGSFDRFASGKTQVLTNCFLASYGFDLPTLSCVVIVRPTKSLMLYLQMVGRGLRTAPDKTDCLLLDHAGCVHRHGFAHDARAWTLDGKRSLADPDPNIVHHEMTELRQIDCPECAAVFAGTRTCPECGFYLAPRGRKVKTLDGDLVEIGVGLDRDEIDHMVFHSELRGFAQECGYKSGWAAYKYREKFGEFPLREWNNEPAALPSITTRRWIKSRTIAWQKAREKTEAQSATP